MQIILLNNRRKLHFFVFFLANCRNVAFWSNVFAADLHNQVAQGINDTQILYNKIAL